MSNFVGNAAKRALDLLCVICGGPFVLGIAAYTRNRIKKDSPGDAIYSGKRLGRRGKLFPCYKFRSMYVNGDEILEKYYAENPEKKAEYEKYHKLDDDPRVTPFGAFILRTSIDELPQVWNVFLGDMSLVGPRPYLSQELEQMGEYAEEILKVKPGITGYWQVNGRSNVDFESRLLMDVWYVKNRTFWMDVQLLCRQDAVEKFFAEEKPEYVFLAAAKVGGIVANSEALADFMYDNMILEMNVIHSAWKNGCKKLEFLGSSCIYPRMAPQPMPESCLLTSELEKTNEAYALAKISGLKYCEFLNKQYGTDYISVMPTNLYGPNDNYHPTHSHVLPALIRRFHEAKEAGAEYVTCWGDGSPLREFLYVDDLANLCVFLMNNYSGDETVNAGTGKELTIKELTELVAKVIGYEGEIRWDTSKPNGTPRKLLDVSKATKLGWTYKTELEEGIRLSYQDFLNNPMRAER